MTAINTVPPDDDIDVAADLLHAAHPVVTRLANDLGDTEISIVLSDDRARGERRRRRGPRARFGWTSLTDTEHVIATLIGDGLTNREAAKRLFVSRFTVDAHLRRIFQKLDINSRVELARIVALQPAQ